MAANVGFEQRYQTYGMTLLNREGCGLSDLEVVERAAQTVKAALALLPRGREMLTTEQSKSAYEALWASKSSFAYAYKKARNDLSEEKQREYARMSDQAEQALLNFRVLLPN